MRKRQYLAQGLLLGLVILLSASVVWRESEASREARQDRAALARELLVLVVRVGKETQAERYAEAEQAMDRALAVVERLWPEKEYPQASSLLVQMLATHGRLLVNCNEIVQAVSPLEKAVALRERLYPREELEETASLLRLLVEVLMDLGEWQRALPHAEKAFALDESLFRDQDHPLRVETLHNLILVLRKLGKAREALSPARKALEMSERLFPWQKDPLTAASLANLAGVYRDLGEWRTALPVCEKAREMWECIYPGQDRSAIAASLLNLTYVRLELGEARKALSDSEKALQMCERLYPRQDNPDTATALTNLALVLSDLGQARKALVYAEQALQMRQRLFPGKDHSAIAHSLNNLGFMLSALGEARKALPYYADALTMRQRLYPGQDHPHTADSLSNLAAVFAEVGEAKKALVYAEQALQMRQRLYPGQDHLDTVRSLTNLANLLRMLGMARKAVPHAEKAVQMCERLYPSQDHPLTATCLNNLAGVLRDLGEWQRALRPAEKALGMRERLFPGQQHWDVAGSLCNLGLLLDHLGENQKALGYFERGVAMNRLLGETAIVLGSEAEAFALTRMLPPARNALLDAALKVPHSDARAYAGVWTSKSALSQTLRLRASLARSANNLKVQQARQNLLESRRLLSARQRHPDPDNVTQAKALGELNARKEKGEATLGALLPQLKEQLQHARRGPEDLSQHLPKQSAFIDFVCTGEGYSAFLLTRGKAACRVELPGSARDIDRAVASWRRSIDAWKPGLSVAARRDLQARTEREAAEVRRLVWAPLVKHLPGEGELTIYLCCGEGELSRLPWAALPGSKPDRVLLQEHLLAIVPDGAFLLEGLTAERPVRGSGERVLAVGGVAFDLPGAKPPAGGYPFLPGTRTEALDVVVQAGKRPSTLLQGVGATSDAVLRHLPQARYAHLATHIFFDEDLLRQEQGRLHEQIRRWNFNSAWTTEPAEFGARNPLCFSGLVLAGANTPQKAGPDRGLLSAEVIAEQTLSGLRLAVLSGCDSGLGEQTEGEAVRGLVQAFHLAGCPDVVASLWPVHDRATAVLMARFYHELWANGRSPLDALRQAQLLLYHRPDLLGDLSGERGAPKLREALKAEASVPAATGKGPALTPTKLWAAFLLSGSGK